jgi:hypothetical protein
MHVTTTRSKPQPVSGSVFSRIEYWEGWRILDVVKAETCFELYIDNLIA